MTNRENEIAGLLCRGLSTKEISSMLIISEFTVYRHLNNIFTKMNYFTLLPLQFTL
ncbi:MAG: helix-turn-helix transcriptional regulator [Firmicutes bacterium]|nr:helix-turn-helix transcriptional regulator [Bacillota bacterium]